MNKSIEKIVEGLKRNKKRIIKSISIGGVVIIVLGVAGATVLYNITKSNINYTEEQAKEIALNLVPGEVVRVRKDLDLEHCTFEYDIKIKEEKNNISNNYNKHWDEPSRA